MTSHSRCAKDSASCDTKFCLLREHRVLADVLLKNFVAAADVLLNFVAVAVFSVIYFSMLLKNFVAAYQSLREACAISGPCTSTRTWSVLVCFSLFATFEPTDLLWSHTKRTK